MTSDRLSKLGEGGFFPSDLFFPPPTTILFLLFYCGLKQEDPLPSSDFEAIGIFFLLRLSCLASWRLRAIGWCDAEGSDPGLGIEGESCCIPSGPGLHSLL